MFRFIEIESKFEILDKSSLDSFLNNLTFIGEKHIVDQYYDTKDGNLFKQGVFVRNRDKQKLDFKFNLEDFQNDLHDNNHEHWDEFSYQFPISQVSSFNHVCKLLSLKPYVAKGPNDPITYATLQEWLDDNNLVKSVTIDKNRKTYRDDIFLYQIDQVERLGTYLEIETEVTERSKIKKLKKEMKERIKYLKLKLVSTGYYELFLRKHNFNLYLEGKYVLAEDK
jgi:adenylate cyclase class IV